MKVVINKCIGGFGLGRKGFERLIELGYKPDEHEMKRYRERFPDHPELQSFYPDVERDDPRLIRVVEELGDEANSCSSKLKVVEIPDDVKWHIHEDETGVEWIDEKHRSWS
jgi:hypothetical protein